MKYILDQKRDNISHNATGKAINDVFAIMNECGVKVVPGVPKDKSKLLRVLDYPILIGFCVFVAGRGDSIIYVYKENTLKIKIVNALRGIKGYKTVCLINDVNSIREGVPEKIDEEFSLIGGANIILAPNEGSIKFMRERGMKNEMIPVKVWDYLMEEPDGASVNGGRGEVHQENALHVAFAGNLGKSAFIKELSEPSIQSDKVIYHLWGDIEDEHFFDGFENVVYEGSVSAAELIDAISTKCDAGLVWDGEKATQIAGVYGEYLRFNNSHKCGCYLAAGLPVIVWTGSGASYFVKQTGCGWCIDSLADIEKIAKKYVGNESAANGTVWDSSIAISDVSKKVRTGYYLKSAIEMIYGGIEND